MSEYMEKFTVSRLVGSPPGYVGYEEGGQLTEAVRRRPYRVVLFDEIEKAHPDVMHLLLQILEDGKVTDSLGRKVDFRNTIIIMTSNVGAELIKRQTSWASARRERDEHDYDEMKEKMLEEAKRVFKPEFLNRLDDIIVFHPLTQADLMQDRRPRSRPRSSRASRAKKIELVAHERGEGVPHREGLRSRRTARVRCAARSRRYLEDPMAEEILRGNVKPGDTVHVVAENDKLVFKAAEPQTAPAGAS